MAKRMTYWKANVERIEGLNRAQSTAVYAEDEYTDWSPDEVAGLMGARINLDAVYPFAEPKTGAPAALDYRGTNRVTYVKNQGSCGSCWAFAAAAVAEGKWAASTSLSTQEMLDCIGISDPCGGYFVDWALQGVQTLGGWEKWSGA